MKIFDFSGMPRRDRWGLRLVLSGALAILVGIVVYNIIVPPHILYFVWLSLCTSVMGVGTYLVRVPARRRS